MGQGYGGGGLSLHCHLQNYFCIKVDCDGSQVISLMVSEDVKHHVY